MYLSLIVEVCLPFHTLGARLLEPDAAGTCSSASSIRAAGGLAQTSGDWKEWRKTAPTRPRMFEELVPKGSYVVPLGRILDPLNPKP